MKIRRTYYRYFIILVVITLVVRLPFLRTWNLGVAPIEIYNVAKNFAEEGKFISSIKANFFTSDPIVHSALGDITLPFTVLVSVLIKLGVGYGGIQILNVILAILAVAVIFFLFDQFFGVNIAFWAALLISFNPYFLRMSIIASDDIFFILLAASAIFIFARWKNDNLAIISAGVLSGLTFMARDAGVFLVLAFLIYYLFFARNLRSFIIYLLSSGVIIIPGFCLLASERGSILQFLALKLIKRSDYDRGLWLGYGIHVPPLIDYLRDNGIFLIKRNLELLYSYWKTLIDFGYLSFSAIFLICLKKEHFKHNKSWLLILYPILNLFIFLTFLNGSNEYRYLLPSFIFLIPFALAALKRLRITLSKPPQRSMSFYSGVVICILTIYLIKGIISCIELERENYFQPAHYTTVSDWVRQHSEQQENFAATIPWVFNLLANRPTVTFPHFSSLDQLSNFIQDYRISYLVVDTGFAPRGAHVPYGELFINGLYQTIKSASPEFLIPLYQEKYVTEKRENRIYLFKVNDQLLSGK